MMREENILSHRTVKILPHAIDTVLLLSAIILVFITEQYPFYHHWLTVKVIALVVYIFLGTMAFKCANTAFSKITYWSLAVMTFAYIVSVALTKTPLWFIPN
jgi:uncharacterized membrane protein SirB2